MTEAEEFSKLWAGRKFKCLTSGEELMIPDTVRQCDFFSFESGAFIDVGRLNSYHRMGGSVEEIKEG